MKTLALVIALLTTLASNAQTVVIDDVETYDRLFKGQIDDKYDITMYLRFVNTSEEHLGIYSVEGWYYYESVKKKIPLVGIFDGGLTAYVFKDQKKKDSVLQFITPELNFWEAINYVKDMKGFDEKFTLETNGTLTGGTWETSKKSLIAQLDASDFFIKKNTEYLRVKDANVMHNYELNSLGMYYSGYKVLSNRKTDQGIRVLLEYNSPSTYFVNGLCGAGVERGFVSVVFDKQWMLQEFIEIPVESCLGNCWSDEQKQSDPKLRVFLVEQDEKTSTVIIDLSTALIKVE
jgi:hypothetical protein